MKLFIFDLDGTLVNSYRAIERSLNSTRKKLGYPEVSLNTVKKNIGRGDRLFIRTFFSIDDEEKALKIYRRYHKRDLLTFASLFPYARYLLYFLKRKKKLIAVASNRPKYFTNLLLKKLNIEKYFDEVVCADEINSLKPDPKIINTILRRRGVKKKEAIFVGDMDIDLETAQRANILGIYVKGGSSPLKEVRKYRNKIIVSNLKELTQLIKNGKIFSAKRR